MQADAALPHTLVPALRVALDNALLDFAGTGLEDLLVQLVRLVGLLARPDGRTPIVKSSLVAEKSSPIDEKSSPIDEKSSPIDEKSSPIGERAPHENDAQLERAGADETTASIDEACASVSELIGLLGPAENDGDADAASAFQMRGSTANQAENFLEAAECFEASYRLRPRIATLQGAVSAKWP